MLFYPFTCKIYLTGVQNRGVGVKATFGNVQKEAAFFCGWLPLPLVRGCPMFHLVHSHLVTVLVSGPLVFPFYCDLSLKINNRQSATVCSLSVYNCLDSLKIVLTVCNFPNRPWFVPYHPFFTGVFSVTFIKGTFSVLSSTGYSNVT